MEVLPLTAALQQSVGEDTGVWMGGLWNSCSQLAKSRGCQEVPACIVCRHGWGATRSLSVPDDVGRSHRQVAKKIYITEQLRRQHLSLWHWESRLATAGTCWQLVGWSRVKPSRNASKKALSWGPDGWFCFKGDLPALAEPGSISSTTGQLTAT